MTHIITRREIDFALAVIAAHRRFYEDMPEPARKATMSKVDYYCVVPFFGLQTLREIEEALSGRLPDYADDWAA